MKNIMLILIIAMGSLAPAAAKPPAKTQALDVNRINAIAAALPPSPSGPGQPITNRPFWAGLSKDPAFSSQIQAAEKLYNTPLPVITKELYLQFSKNGNRTNYEHVVFSRRNRLVPYVVAECLEGQNRFLPALNNLIDEICKNPTWVLPAHDRDLSNFNGTTITIDLFSSALAWQLAEADYLLGDRLAPATRATLRREINRRVIAPFQAMIRLQRPADWWITGENNWNPVCFSGVTGAALIQVADARDRAEIVAAAEHYSDFFLKGFTEDGYCSEGVGYWNYGFGTYAAMAENLRHCTGGTVDLFAKPGAAMPATYGARIGIINGAMPIFADCPLSSAPSSALLWLLNRVYQWQLPEYSKLDSRQTLGSITEAMLFQQAKSTPVSPVSSSKPLADPVGKRTFFEDAGVYIGRPDPVTGKADDFAVAFKAGNNGEQHNHNDVGSYIVVIGSTPILLDPGRETYTKRTFSAQRYESKLLNSYGHSVPVVAGELQKAGKKFSGKILSQNFTDTTDTVVMDISGAYNLKGLKKLTRTFEYGRSSRVLVVTDEVEFRKPRMFETALISLGDFRADLKAGAKSGAIRVKQGAVNAFVAVDATAPITTSKDTIVENAPVKPNRLAIKFVEPVSSARVRMTVMPQ